MGPIAAAGATHAAIPSQCTEAHRQLFADGHLPSQLEVLEGQVCLGNEHRPVKRHTRYGDDHLAPWFTIEIGHSSQTWGGIANGTSP